MVAHWWMYTVSTIEDKRKAKKRKKTDQTISAASIPGHSEAAPLTTQAAVQASIVGYAIF